MKPTRTQLIVSATAAPVASDIVMVTPRLYSRSRSFAATGTEADRRSLHAAALRFAARRVRATGDIGSEEWATALERMADQEEMADDQCQK